MILQLKQQQASQELHLKEQMKIIREQARGLKLEKLTSMPFLFHILPIQLAGDEFEGITVTGGSWWLSKPFYTHIGGYKLQVGLFVSSGYFQGLKYTFLGSEFTTASTGRGNLTITLELQADKHSITKSHKLDLDPTAPSLYISLVPNIIPFDSKFVVKMV